MFRFTRSSEFRLSVRRSWRLLDDLLCLVTRYDLGFTGSFTTMRKVQICPRSREPSHQRKPLRPLLCASPALISESVNQPTAYSPAFCERFMPTVGNSTHPAFANVYFNLALVQMINNDPVVAVNTLNKYRELVSDDEGRIGVELLQNLKKSLAGDKNYRVGHR